MQKLLIEITEGMIESIKNTIKQGIYRDIDDAVFDAIRHKFVEFKGDNET